METGTKASPMMVMPESHFLDGFQRLALLLHPAASTSQRMTIAATKTQRAPWRQSRKILPEPVPDSQDKHPISKAPLHAQTAGLPHVADLLL
jgi:hypothetical protein